MKPAMPNEQQEPMWLSAEGKTYLTAEKQRNIRKIKMQVCTAIFHHLDICS